MQYNIKVNGRNVSADVAPETPLLWVLRDHLDLTGTKYGCGGGFCGACTVHVGGQPVRSCQTPISSIGDNAIGTIEGLDAAHPELISSWIQNNVPQCGYCQSGQLMSAAALLDSNPAPTDADIDNAMSGNICRCGTYTRIRASIKEAAASRRGVAIWEAPADGGRRHEHHQSLSKELLPGRRYARARCDVAGSSRFTRRQADIRLGTEPFLGIDPDGTVTVTSHRSEMGQGIRTAIAQVVADELDADWSRVRVAQAPGDQKYGDQNTDGSRSILMNYDRLRDAGASARLMLRQAAADAWGVSVDEVVAENHRIKHARSGKDVDYGTFVADAAALPVPANPTRKRPPSTSSSAPVKSTSTPATSSTARVPSGPTCVCRTWPSPCSCDAPGSVAA